MRSNECSRCGRLYKTRKGLKHHIKNECGVEPRFQCIHCDWKFKQKAHLLRHVARKHTASWERLHALVRPTIVAGNVISILFGAGRWMAASWAWEDDLNTRYGAWHHKLDIRMLAQQFSGAPQCGPWGTCVFTQDPCAGHSWPLLLTCGDGGGVG